MNIVSLIGRLTGDPELRFTPSGKEVARFGLAVDRPFDKENTDFLNIIVWGKRAVNCANYLTKGRRVGVVGRIQTRSYEKDKQKRYVTEIIASEVEFLEWGKEKKTDKQDNEIENFQQVDDEDDEVPF